MDLSRLQSENEHVKVGIRPKSFQKDETNSAIEINGNEITVDTKVPYDMHISN